MIRSSRMALQASSEGAARRPSQTSRTTAMGMPRSSSSASSSSLAAERRRCRQKPVARGAAANMARCTERASKAVKRPGTAEAMRLSKESKRLCSEPGEKNDDFARKFAKVKKVRYSSFKVSSKKAPTKLMPELYPNRSSSPGSICTACQPAMPRKTRESANRASGNRSSVSSAVRETSDAMHRESNAGTSPIACAYSSGVAPSTLPAKRGQRA
mmetsp:Transcript_30305/g.86687  ORF Transcript_30305/g.86687 Transcript_30305/m.86687 type:complete len:214 (+) Transcript_30305:239-880(+)